MSLLIRQLMSALTENPRIAAQALLGCQLISGSMKALIVETEAYGGTDDPASHAYRGLKPRNVSMFSTPGVAYVYFTYGMHWMLNVSCLPEGVGSGVLLRAAVPLEGQTTMRSRRPKARSDNELLSGPGKLAAAFGINRSHDGIELFSENSELSILPMPAPETVLVGTRIGISHPQGAALRWRYAHPSHLPWVSRPHAFTPQPREVLTVVDRALDNLNDFRSIS